MKPLRTLVVEDNLQWFEDFHDNLRTISSADLVGTGYGELEITHVTNQADADKAIADSDQQGYDLIFLDLNYPLTADTPLNNDDGVPEGEKDFPEEIVLAEGLEGEKNFPGMIWLSELRRLQPHAAIVILTSYAETEHLKNAIDAIRDYRANDFIPKTASFEAIVTRIRVAWVSAQRTQLLTELQQEFRDLVRTRAARTWAEDIGLILGRAKTSLLNATKHLESGDTSLVARVADTIRTELKRLQNEFDELALLLNVEQDECMPVDVAQLTRQMSLLYQGVSARARAKISSPNEDTALSINTYKGDLKVTLHEVIANGLEALEESQTPPEERELTLAVRRVEEEVVVEITDNGGGFSKEALENLYKRGYSSKKDTHHHQGLGLYIAKRMMNYLGGTIEIYSREEKGVTVRLTLRNLE